MAKRFISAPRASFRRSLPTISFAERLKRGIYTPGDKVLDVGCAAGHMLRSLVTRLDSDISYTGLDFNPYYLELARKAFGHMT
jgi:ubiquinone/menaquinone biosynthesis C-methylase UbiE